MLSKHIVEITVKGPFTHTAPRPYIKYRRIALVVAALLTLSSCSTPGGPQPPLKQPVTAETASAEELLALARSAEPEAAAELFLDAAWAFLDREDTSTADLRSAIDAFHLLESGWLDESRLADYQLLAVRVALFEGDTASAKSSFEAVSEQSRQSPRGLEIQSELCAIEYDFGCAIEKLLLVAGSSSTRHNERIWTFLNRSTSFQTLRAPLSENQQDADLTSWQALHRMVVESFSVADASRAVSAWLSTHPDHPAAKAPPATVGKLATFQPEPLHVALLLPLSGPLARAGEAVRDGFIAASLLAGSRETFRLSIHDTTSDPTPVLYERLLADGADMIVGPLQKETATELNALNPDIPTLVLNYLDPESSPALRLLQFGLAIEDEAATIAVRLEEDEVTTALLFHNYEDWSLRARRALLDASDSELTIQPFTDMRTITEAVGVAMHVAGSQARRDQLAATLGIDLEFLPRARGDVDAVVALIDNAEANALVPALRFHFAEHLPVYASSQVARRTRADQLTPLDGFQVSELPWFLNGDAVYGAMREAFSLDNNPFASLVALGTDAYRISERLSLTENRMDLVMVGSTGLLTLNEDGRIARELVWGNISSGQISAYDGSAR